MSWSEVKKINSDFINSPLNHLIWLNDYKTYGQNSYVYNNKDIWNELMSDYKLCVNDTSTSQISILYSDSIGEAGKAFESIYGSSVYGTHSLDDCETIEDVYVKDQDVFVYTYNKFSWLRDYVKTNKSTFISLGLTILDTLKLQPIMNNILLYQYSQIFNVEALTKIANNSSFTAYLRPITIGGSSNYPEYLTDSFTQANVSTFPIYQNLYYKLQQKPLTFGPGTWAQVGSGLYLIGAFYYNNSIKYKPEKHTGDEIVMNAQIASGANQGRLRLCFFEGDVMATADGGWSASNNPCYCIKLA